MCAFLMCDQSYRSGQSIDKIDNINYFERKSLDQMFSLLSHWKEGKLLTYNPSKYLMGIFKRQFFPKHREWDTRNHRKWPNLTKYDETHKILPTLKNDKYRYNKIKHVIEIVLMYTIHIWKESSLSLLFGHWVSVDNRYTE